MTATRWIGTERARPETPDKVTGKTAYVGDLSVPGMLFGAIKFSAHARARIVRIDVERAKRLPGVVAVITGYDTPPVKIGFLRDNVALKRDVVRQFRDEVAAVAAVDRDTARRAVDLIEVEYEPLPGVFDPEEALAPGAPLVHETSPDGKPATSNLVPLRFHHESGDLAAAKKASRHVVTRDYSVPRIQQCCLGTAGCIADLDGNGNLTIHAKTQIPFLAQRDFVKALAEMGLPDRNCRVIVPALGGGFGTGLDTHAYEYVAILLSHRTGRPVKITYEREEEFAFLSPRQSARIRLSQGCDERGRLTFREMDVLQDNGAYTSWGATYPSVMLLPATSLYRVPAVRFDARIVYTNNTYCQAMRGYGNPEATWAIETNLDELAEKAGIDALEMRRRNCNEPGETTPMGLKVTTCGLRECLDSVGKGLGWEGARGKGSTGKGPAKRGVGMASLVHVGGGGRIYRSDGSGLLLKVDDYGNVNACYGGVEMGQGLHSVLVLAVAEAVGVRPERVFVNPTDTATCPWDVGTHASRGAFMACSAAILAGKRLRERIFSLAADVVPDLVRASLSAWRKAHGGDPAGEPEFLSGLTPASFDLRDGVVTIAGAPDEPWARVDFARFLRAIHFRQGGDLLAVDVFYDPPTDLPDWSKGMGNLSAAYTYGTQGAEVEVDEETGEVRVLHLVSALDIGKVLNPPALRGQVYGGIVQGLGYALYEEVRTREGRVLNPSFSDYKIPTAFEAGFPMDLVFVETDDPRGPFGAKGAGEPGMVPTAPAIANAVYDAVGVRIFDLPITPEKVVAALAAKRAAEGNAPR